MEKITLKEEAIKAVSNNKHEITSCCLSLLSDEDVVMAALLQDDDAFQFADNSLKSNKDFIIEPCGKPPRSRGGWIAILNPNNA